MTLDETDQTSLLASAVRRRIIEHLSGLPPIASGDQPSRSSGLTAAELGEVLGLHSTTVRFHLDQLTRAHLVRAQSVRSGGAGRPSKKYAAVDPEAPQSTVDVEGPYQVLSTLLAETMVTMQNERVTPEEAGAAWVRRRLEQGEESGEVAPPARSTGEWLGKVGNVVDLLTEWGYQPDLSLSGPDDEITLTLRDCPFISLARTHPSVVCGVHRGLLQGAIELAGEPQAELSLRPFFDESTCHAVIVRHARPSADDQEVTDD